MDELSYRPNFDSNSNSNNNNNNNAMFDRTDDKSQYRLANNNNNPQSNNNNNNFLLNPATTLDNETYVRNKSNLINKNNNKNYNQSDNLMSSNPLSSSNHQIMFNQQSSFNNSNNYPIQQTSSNNQMSNKLSSQQHKIQNRANMTQQMNPAMRSMANLAPVPSVSFDSNTLYNTSDVKRKMLPAYSQMSIPNSFQQFYNNNSNNINNTPFSSQTPVNHTTSNFDLSNQNNLNDDYDSSYLKYDNNWTFTNEQQPKDATTTVNINNNNNNHISNSIYPSNANTFLARPITPSASTSPITNNFNLYSIIDSQNKRITQPYQHQLMYQLSMPVQHQPPQPLLSQMSSNQLSQNQKAHMYHQLKAKSLDADSFMDKNQNGKLYFTLFLLFKNE